jgi:hypothetical protein
MLKGALAVGVGVVALLLVLLLHRESAEALRVRAEPIVTLLEMRSSRALSRM